MGWVEELKALLSSLGVSFEVEESVRIHVGDVVAEVVEEDGSITVTASVSLPTPDAGPGDVDYYASQYRTALRLMLGLGGGLEYELDTSLPDYPLLRIVKRFREPGEVLEALRRSLESLKRSTVSD